MTDLLKKDMDTPEKLVHSTILKLVIVQFKKQLSNYKSLFRNISINHSNRIHFQHYYWLRYSIYRIKYFFKLIKLIGTELFLLWMTK